MMRKIFIVLCCVVMATTASAQSSMTDKAVMEYIIKEQEKGTSQSQIVADLMRKGVTVEQIRRIRNTYEKEQSTGDLGIRNITTTPGGTVRTRENNGASTANLGRQRKDLRQDATKKSVHTYDEQDNEYVQMRDELNTFMPDTFEMYEQFYMDAMKVREKEERKIFGHDIFNSENLSFEPAMNITMPENYLIGPGDDVFVDIWGASNNTFENTVSPDGTIQIEGFGPVSIGGMTVGQANEVLREQLGPRYENSQVRLTVGQTRTITVNVMGEVVAPGTYTLAALATVFHALYMAQGVNDIGTLRDIKVYRNNRLITTVDIYDYILNGKLSGNVRLEDDDVIVVGPYDCLVNITGKVKRPMFYEMKNTESVATLLGYSGGFAGDAYTKSVRLVRKSGIQYSVYNVGEFDMASFRLADGDSLSVDSVLPRYSNMVEVRGAVFRPGMYQLDGGASSVRSLIECAEGITEDAFTSRAVMHRMKEDRSLEALSVDLVGILSGTSPDIPLRNEDVLYVPSKRELLEQQTLTIHGEVLYPGEYDYAENETVEDLILQAGGLTDAASLMKVDVSRRNNFETTESVDTIGKLYSFTLKDGFVVDGTPGFTLQPYDEIYVRSNPSYSKQKNVTVEGEVLYPGTYSLELKNQRISEIISKAGGPTALAYMEGARVERKMTDEEQAKVREVKELLLRQSGVEDTLVNQIYDLETVYNVSLNLGNALKNPGSTYDIMLQEGDRIIIPEYKNTVKISGAVMRSVTTTYVEGKGINYYIKQAGGYGNKAKKRNTIVSYVNGNSSKKGFNTKVEPGCEIIVPSKENKQRMTTSEVLAIGTSSASVVTMLITIANLVK